MKPQDQLKRRSIAIAEGFFYCDDECCIPWEPFEHYSRSELKKEAGNLAALIYKSMVWAQENN
jgi:hypothetical protein